MITVAKKAQDEKVSITQLREVLDELVGTITFNYDGLVKGTDPLTGEPLISPEGVLQTLEELQEAADDLQLNIGWLTKAYQQVASVRV